VTTTYTYFLFVDAETETTHVLAWDPNIREWLIPCHNIERPHRDRVTYSPTKPMCRTCINLTQPATRTAPRTTHR
jgi:hypothetical protein